MTQLERIAKLEERVGVLEAATKLQKTYDKVDVARRYGVSDTTVLKWLRSGDLKAINVGGDSEKKPTWCILESHLLAFERLRSPLGA